VDYEQLGALPIAGGEGAGCNPAGSHEYEVLQEEVDHTNRPTSSGITDWQRIISVAEDVLAHIGKDVRVACYLGVGLVRLRGLSGLYDSIRLLRGMLSKFWDTCHPVSERARRKALEWWLVHSNDCLRALPAHPVAADKLALIKDAINELDDLLRDRDPDGISVVEMLRTIERFPEEPPEHRREPPPASVEVFEESMDPISQWIGSIELVGYDLALDRLAHAMTEIATLIHHSAPSSALAFRLRRVGAWLTLTELPPATEQITTISAPPSYVIDRLHDIVGCGSAIEIVNEAENLIGQYRYWLDPHRCVAVALDQLGPSYVSAAQENCVEVAALLRRLPGIERLAFSDGTPFADEATLAWLAHIAPERNLLVEQDDPGASRDSCAGAMERARSLATSGQVHEALCVLVPETSTLSGRSGFVLRLAVAELLLDFSQIDQSRMASFYAGLVHDIDRHALEHWEPDLALQGLTLAYRGIETCGDIRGEGSAGCDQLLTRIAVLQPIVGVRLGARL